MFILVFVVLYITISKIHRTIQIDSKLRSKPYDQFLIELNTLLSILTKRRGLKEGAASPLELKIDVLFLSSGN